MSTKKTKSSDKKKSSGPPLAEPSYRVDDERFARGLLRRALAQILFANKIKTSEGGAMEGMVDACRSRLMDFGTRTRDVCEQSHRKKAKLEDGVRALMGFSPRVEMQDLIAEPKHVIPVLSQVPMFPLEVVETVAPPMMDLEDGSKSQRVGNLMHFPPIPPLHAFKMENVDSVASSLEDLSQSAQNDLKRAQQRRSTLVRESLAKMRRDFVQGKGEIAKISAGDFKAAMAGSTAETTSNSI